MLISTALAAGPASQAPGAFETFAMNMLMILIIVVLFYVLLIMPQQKRFKQHRSMLDALKKGDKIVTSGGLVGKVHDFSADRSEVVVDLGDGVKVTALRSAIQNKVEKPDTKQSAAKKEVAAKKEAAVKAAGKKDAPKDAKTEAKK